MVNKNHYNFNCIIFKIYRKDLKMKISLTMMILAIFSKNIKNRIYLNKFQSLHENSPENKKILKFIN